MKRQIRTERRAPKTPASTHFRRTVLATACLLAMSGANAQQQSAYSATYNDGTNATAQTPYLGGYTLSLTERRRNAGHADRFHRGRFRRRQPERHHG